MRFLMGMTAALVLALTACSDDSDGDAEAAGTPPPSEITIDCAEFEDTAALITQAQTDLYSGTGGPEVIETLVTELEALEEGAPADVRLALSDMADAFREAQSLLEDPTPKKQRELVKLAPKLANQSQTITDHVVEQCE